MISLYAPAKLTLSLEIMGIRDDGYHLIEAEMVSLDLMDELEVSDDRGNGGIEISTEYPNQPWGFDTESSVPDNENNLVSKALNLLNVEKSIHIRKKIPPGAGLGGGSADAAAVLRWGGFKDFVAASRLGADVSFCLQGGRAIVAGIGEKITPVAYLEQTFTLLIPPFSCSTVEVYDHWDRIGGPRGENGNDLEPAALDLYPALRKWRDQLGEATGISPRLAGSGSTWFVEGSFPQKGHHVVSTITTLEQN